MLFIELKQDKFHLSLSKSEFLKKEIIVKETRYILNEDSKKSNGFVGFFDWLRKDEFTIVGIRFCFFDYEYYDSIFGKYDYLDVTNEGKWIEILFTRSRYDLNISGDQDFSNNFIYTSDSGILLTVGLDNLTEDELNSLLVIIDI